MRRIHLVRWLLVVAVVMVAYVVLQPSPPAASAYPSTLRTYDAPTAWQSGCEFPRVCTNNTCYVGTDPNVGCKFVQHGCQGCLI